MAALMKRVLLTHKDVTFQVAVDSDTEELLKTDESFRNQYAQRIFETCLSKDESAEKTSEGQTELAEASTACQSIADNSNSSFQNQDNSELSITTLDFFWTHQSTVLLIENRLSMDDQFNNPKFRKSKLWLKIAETMQANNFNVSGQLCDSKWRNLLQTYRKIKGKGGQEGRVSWEYYSMLNKILGKRRSPTSSPKTLSSSLIHIPESSSDSSSEPQPKKKKKSSSVDARPDWFYSMMQRLDERDSRVEEGERKKTDDENKRWNTVFNKLDEIRKVEEQKVTALNKLTVVFTKCLENLKTE